MADRHERSPALDATRQTSPFKSGIGFRHRAEANPQFPCDIAMRRQAVASRQPPFDDVVGESEHQPLGGIRLYVGETWCPWRLKEHVRHLDKSVT
ncbi:hypothetical protein D9M72_546060 [compost metagenome]